MTDNPAARQPEVELVELCEVASETDEAGEAGAALRMPSPSSSEGGSTDLGSLPSRAVSPESSELQAYLVYRQAAVERGGGSVAPLPLRPDSNESAAVDGDGRSQAVQAHEEEEEENEEQEEQGPADGSPMSAQLCIHVVRDPDSGAAGYTVHRSSLVISATNEESVAYANGMREGYRITHVGGRQIQVRPLPPHLVHGRHMSSVPLLDCKW
eukprot:COSAG01_NODE_937_length_12628_cov_12.665257_8_plen_212_part_00